MSRSPKTLRAAAIGWTLLILLLLSIPGDSLPGVSYLDTDKVAHVLLFMGFSYLWMATLAGGTRSRVAWVAGFGLAYAVLSEVYQGVVPLGRSADAFDAVANVVGILLGIGLFMAWSRWRPGKVTS